MKHVYIIQKARGRRRRRSDIDIDTDIDISYMRGDFGEVPVPIISVDVHLGYLSLNEPTGSAVVINCVIWDACMILVCVYKQHFTYVYLFICVCVCHHTGKLPQWNLICRDVLGVLLLFLSVFMLKFI